MLLLTQKQEIWHIISSEIQFYLVDFSQFLVQLIPKIAIKISPRIEVHSVETSEFFHYKDLSKINSQESEPLKLQKS